MDSLFLLCPKTRLHFLQKEVQTLGCAYICLWYYLPPPSNCLFSMDGWYNEDESEPSSSTGSYKKRLFEDYKSSFYSVESGCVPGLAFMQGFPCIELEDSALMNSASTFVQLEFYKEAGIKKAVFIGCNCGEIELGSLTSINANIHHLFNNDFIKFDQSQTKFGDLMQFDQNILSSSSTSSLKSLSVGSPEYTSISTSQHQINIDPYNLYRNLLHPSPQNDNVVLTKTLLDIISSSHTDFQHHMESRINQTSSTFKPFDLVSKSNRSFNFGLEGQRMIKKSILLLRKMYSLKYGESRWNEEIPMSRTKLKHVIAERKRRVKINESLKDLRMLLPHCSKKDYVTVLSRTKDYLRALKTQINELKERNYELKMQLKSNKKIVQTTSNERVEVQFVRKSESKQINLLIIVREEVENMIDLLLKVLDCLKGMGIMNLTEIDASSNPTMASLTIQVQASDFDEDSLRQSLIMVILDTIKDTR